MIKLNKILILSGLFLFIFGVQSVLAQDSGKMQWKGAVDNEAQVIIRAKSATTKVVTGVIYSSSFKFEKALPRVDVKVELNKKNGRGDVTLIQQPVSTNNYTAIVRIKDEKGGRDNYEFELKWKVTSSIRWSEKDFDNGYRLGTDDFNKNQSRDYFRYKKKFDSKNEISFKLGYEEGYDTARSGSANSGGDPNTDSFYYNQGLRYGGEDYRAGLTRNYQRYTDKYDYRFEFSFRRGYEEGYDAARNSSGNNSDAVTPMNLYQDGNGNFSIAGRQREQILRATVNLRANRDVEIVLYRATGSSINFRGKLTGSDTFKLYVQLTSSGNANAVGYAEVAYINNSGISSLKLNGSLDGQQFSADFTR